MGYINTKLKNGNEVGIGDYELILSVSPLENMSEEEIGKTVIALLPYAYRLRAYSQLGPDQRGFFESLEDFEQAEALGRIIKPKQEQTEKFRGRVLFI